MKRILIAMVLACGFAQASPVRQPNPPLKFDFQMLQVGQVIQLIYAEALKQPYVIDPEVLADARAVSFRYDAQNGDMRPFIVGFLDSLGLKVVTTNGIDYVSRKKDIEKTEQPELETFVYRPKHRDVGYISRVLAPVFKGAFANNRAIAAPEGAKVTHDVPQNSASAMIDQSADVLLFTGTAKEVATLQKLLPQIDDAKGQVMIRGVVYEVETGDKEGSAFTLAMGILGGRFNFLNAGATLDTAFKIKTGSIDAVFSALSSDNRFNVVSKPSIRVLSGDTGTFHSGKEVPVLGAVSYPSGAGQAVQQVDYRNSGVSFEVKPKVMDGAIDVKVKQQISDFVQTTTGVNNSPTLNKREVETSLSMQDGDVVLLGGLTQEKQTGTHSGLSFLPSFLHSRSGENTKTEILLVLQLQKF
ncbi:type II secretion system protein GspD [Undibacterium sp. Ji83W]|uniref:type II secretion system protein GspD n=1 Tax=Undibacterium sp. Ji83W TaxID=3413043 RepID=UPI003BF31C0C